ncbi:MAG: hypothetical protein AAF266_00420 [Planctomycetota bacterium]
MSFAGANQLSPPFEVASDLPPTVGKLGWVGAHCFASFLDCKLTV